jgi:heme oxygenase
MSKKNNKEIKNNPEGGFLGDIKQKAEEVMSQAVSFFGMPKDEKERKDKLKKKYDDLLLLYFHRASKPMQLINRIYFRNLRGDISGGVTNASFPYRSL